MLHLDGWNLRDLIEHVSGRQSLKVKLTSHITPSGAKPPASASQQAFLLFGLGVFIKLLNVQFRNANEGGDQHNEEDRCRNSSSAYY